MKAPKSEAPEPRPDVSYTLEGAGVVATCQACWWTVWKPDQHTAESTAASDHKKCRAEDLAFARRRRNALRTSRR